MWSNIRCITGIGREQYTTSLLSAKLHSSHPRRPTDYKAISDQYTTSVSTQTPVTPTTPSPTVTVLQQVEQMKAYRLPDNLWDPTAVLLRDPPPEMVSRITRARKVYLYIPHVRAQVLLDLQSARLQGRPKLRGWVSGLGHVGLGPRVSSSNAMSLQTQRGDGLWLWTAYLINTTLHALLDGDYVMQKLDRTYRSPSGPPRAPEWHLERRTHPWSRPTTVAVLQAWRIRAEACHTPCCHDAMQVNGAFSVWRKNFHSLRVVDAWLRDCMDHQSFSDSPSSSPELPAFRKHWHDQAILTNVLTREGWGRDVTSGPLLENVFVWF